MVVLSNLHGLYQCLKYGGVTAHLDSDKINVCSDITQEMSFTTVIFITAQFLHCSVSFWCTYLSPK